MRFFLSLILLLMGMVSIGVADEVRMKDGRAFTGKIVSQSDSKTVIDTMIAGIRTRLTLEAKEIDAHETKPLPKEFFGPEEPLAEVLTQGSDFQVVTDDEGRFGFIDSKGKAVIKPQFDFAMPFTEGLACVVVGDRIGYINAEGVFHVNPKFELGEGIKALELLYAAQFVQGVAGVQVDGAIGFIDRRGKFSIQPRFDRVGRFNEGLAFAQEGSRTGYIDKRGRWKIQLKGNVGGEFSEGLAAVSNGDKWGFVNPAGRFAIEPQFDRAWAFAEGLAVVQVGGRFGFINSAGEYTINPKYDHAWAFSQGLAAVVDDGKIGFVDAQGKVVIEPTYDVDKADRVLWVGFSNGYARIKKDGKYGFVEKSGGLAFGTYFDWTSDFRDGIAKVMNGDHLHWIDRSGNTLWKSKREQEPAEFVESHQALTSFLIPSGVLSELRTTNTGEVDVAGGVVRGGTMNLLKLIDPSKDTVKGTWFSNPDGSIQNRSQNIHRSGPMIRIPVTLPTEYVFSMTFTRTNGRDAVSVSLPVGQGSIRLVMNSQRGDGVWVSELVDVQNEFVLQTNRKYQVTMRVKKAGDIVHVETELDGKAFLSGKWLINNLVPKNPNDEFAQRWPVVKITAGAVKISKIECTAKGVRSIR